MELKDFINNFAAQFDETDPAEITATTLFHDLDEWGRRSRLLSIIARWMRRYDVALKGADINGSADS